MIRALLDGLAFHRFPTTAEGWFARAKSRPLTSAEHRQFAAWIASDSANRGEYERCLQVGQLWGRVKTRADLVKAMPAYQGLVHDRAGHLVATRIVPWRVATALAIGGACVLVVLGLVLRIGGDELPTQIATRVGEQRELPLQDGSRVHLNTDSSLTVAFSDRERRVLLARGEGYFDVTKDADNRPFIVEVGNTEVRVVGTRFSVRATDAGADVIVSEGKVEVLPDTRRQSPSMPAKVELIPGNALHFDRRERLVRIAAVDPEVATAWRTGTIRFEDVPLMDMIGEVNRYASTPFVIADDRIKAIRVSGSFRVGDIQSVRFALVGFGIDATSEDGRIVLR